MSDITKEELRDRLGNVDQIRDIIFGAQLRDYDSRLAKVESGFTLLQQEMRDRIDQLKDSLSAELKTTVDALEKKLKLYHATNQEECFELRQQVDRLSRKFSTSIQTLDETLDTQTQTLRNELVQSKDKLQEDVSALRDLVLEELDRRFSDLKEAKVSREDLAETLFALGMRLKGTEFIPKLKEAVTEEEDRLPLLETRKILGELSRAL
jgi:uncharacterized protein YfbU (UPF0304 family)